MGRYKAAEDIKQGASVIIGVDGKLYNEVAKEAQVFNSFFDEFTFGKHRTETLTEVIQKDRAYILWQYGEGIINIGDKIFLRFKRELGID